MLYSGPGHRCDIVFAIDPVLLKKKYRTSIPNYYGERTAKADENSSCTTEIVQKHCIYDMCSIKPDTPQPAVIIIGAGMAGLSAAKRLVQCGITNFKVLEATDRPGGRIHTCWMGDAVIEMGSEFINGASIANPIYTLAAQEQLLTSPLKRIDDIKPIFFTSDGRAIDVDITRKASKIFENLKTKAANMFYTERSLPEQNLSTFFEQLFIEELKKLPEIERYDSARIFYGMSNGLKSSLGADLDDVNSTSFVSIHQLPGGNIRIPLGMSGILAPLVRDLPEGAVVYCKPIHCIRWGTAGAGNPRVVVRCCDGEEFPADYVIVTVPLGVLKQKSDQLFCPALPACKIDAIRNLGFGHVGKIFIQQDNPFWVGSSGNFLFAWSPQELRNKDGWIKGITGFTGVHGSTKVLQATVAGSEAKEMEQNSDEVIIDDIKRVLQMFMGDATLPSPKEVMRTDWSTNPYFYGAFTFIGVNSNVGHIKNLSEPLPGNECEGIPPIILFAGEHTSAKYFSTLHGARETGIREADRIIAATKKYNGPPNKGPVCIPCETECVV